MRHPILIFYLIFICTVAKSQETASCEEIRNQLSTVMNTQSSIKTLEEIQKTDPNLIVLGEHHYDHLFWKMSHVYRYFKNLVPDVNCLFSEISQDTTNSEIMEMIRGKKNEIFYSNRRLGFGPLYQSIYEIDDNVILVDAPRAVIEKTYDDDDASWLTRRDTYMINRIETAYNNLDCAGAIYNVGAQHLRNNLDDDSLIYSSFGERVKKVIPKTIVIDRGDDNRFYNCVWELNSFIAPASNEQIRAFFKLDERESSADYILYLRSMDIMFALEQ